MGVENVVVIKTKIQKLMKQCQNTGTSWWKQTCMLCYGHSNFYLGPPQSR